MIFVFTAVIMFFCILFWNIERLNRIAQREKSEASSVKPA